jgi:hypothetical protein
MIIQTNVAGQQYAHNRSRLISDKGFGRAECAIYDACMKLFATFLLQYACRYWVGHLQKCDLDSFNDKSDSFLHDHLLHWLEALSVMGSQLNEELNDTIIVGTIAPSISRGTGRSGEKGPLSGSRGFEHG